MYQHPQALHLNADYMQHELLRDAEARRLAHPVSAEFPGRHFLGLSPFRRRMVALAVALVSILGVVAVLI